MRARAVAIIMASVLAGCATEVLRVPAELSMPQSPLAARYVVLEPADVWLDSGYQRRIESGTQLAPFGRVPQGDVFRPTSTVLTVEGAHVHEAYLVVAEGRLIGFYLPVEKAFAPLSRPVRLSIQRKGD
jgi:hypothetical protein